MPNVVVDARGLTFRPSGARTRLVELYSAYAARDDAFDVQIVTTAGRGARELLGPLGISVVEHEHRRTARVLAAVHVAVGSADILHCETSPIPVAQRAPVALTVHDLRSIEEPDLAYSRAKGVYERRALPRLARFVERFVAVSDTTASRIEDLLGASRERIAVVPNGVSGPTNASDPPVGRDATEGRPFVLALGHLEPRKNLEVLLDVMHQLAQDEAFGIRDLVIAGRDHGLADRLLARHASSAGTYRLHVLTDVDDDERDALLRSARCLLAPSRHEGFGLVPLEAMARGTPVIASDSAVTREVLGDGAVLVDTREPGHIADAIRELESHTATRDALVARGRRTVESYSWSRSAEALHATYASMLSR